MCIRNWKTSLSGVAALMAVLAKVVNGHADWATDIPMAIAAIGLIFAKDGDVTGIGANARRAP